MIVVREASSTRKMSGIATNPSTRVASRGLTCLRLLLVSVLGTLALAASAQAPSVARADETTSSEQAPPPAGGEQAPPAEASTPAEAPPEETTPPSEEAKPPAEETTPPEEKAPVDELPPEETTPPVEETKPPAEETKPPEEPKPAEEPPPPPAEEKAPPAEETKLAEETQSGESKEKLAAGTEGNHEQPLTPVGEAAQERPAEGATSATVEGAGVPTGNLAPPPIAGEPGEVSPSAVLGAVALATHHTSGLGCTLSALEGASNCAAGWVEVKSLLSGTSGGLAGVATTAATWTAAAAGAPVGEERGDGGASGSRPVSPTPGPAPGGASGGAATGSAGAAPSAFLTLSGLLHLSAPRAMRRLRLSCRPWLTAFFVLIPERPG